MRNHYVAEIGDYISPSALNNSHITEGMLTNALKETCYYYSDPLDSKSSPKQFGFPFAANTMLLVYNKDIFENSELMSEFKTLHDKTLAPPTKFSELLEISEFISSSNLGFHGICLQGASDGWLYYELCNFLFGMGTGTSQKWYGWQEDAPLTISTPKNVEVLNYYKRLYQTTTGDYYTVGASQQREIMLDGKTAMCLMWSDYLLPLAQSKEIRFGFLPIPGNVSGLAGGAFYLNKNSAHIEAASQFILYALTPETQERLLKAGLCSAQRLAYTSDVQRAVPYANALLTSLERGVFMFEAGTDAEIISSEITTWVQKFIRGEVSAEIALKKAQAEISTKKTKMNI